MRNMYLTATEEKIRRIRLYKTFGKVLYSLIILTLIVILFIKIDTVMKMQADALDQMNYIRQEVETLKDIPESAPEVKIEPISLGEFTVTHYCPCAKCCGKSDGITYTGTQATEGRTIAVDPNVIPLGSEIIIEGQAYIAEDVGGAIKGNKLDIFVDSHQEAINRGKIKREVKLMQ